MARLRGCIMKDVLAIVTPVYADSLGQAAHYAFAVAGLSGAYVTALITEIEPVPPARMSDPDIMQGGVETTEPPSTRERVAHTIELFKMRKARERGMYRAFGAPLCRAARDIDRQCTGTRHRDYRRPRPVASSAAGAGGSCAIREWSPDHSRAARRSCTAQRKEPWSPGMVRVRLLEPCTMLCRY